MKRTSTVMPSAIACLLAGTLAAPTIAAAQTSLGAEDYLDLATLSMTTAPLRDLQKANDAGWDFLFGTCMESAAGGMGEHYLNLAEIDGAVSAERPEALLFEPMKNGGRRLVAVEYIVPPPFVDPANPPELFGQDFHYSAANDVWILHVWIWRHNPTGMFEDWNPVVSCQYAN